MSVQPGSALGHYRIAATLGAGGMGEVYRAVDTRLGREVAIKVLPDEVAGNEERLARFDREAHVLASLNHPNIATLFGFETDGDTSFLVMELVEGETLAERIAHGPIPVNEAIPLFVQIAEGLEAAHDKGIIHRDLKPANIKITDDDRVKILDFGLAKAMAPEIPETDLTHSPTLTAAATRRGEILGTAAYMSPEQARGKAIDKRTDIWAFGCCLWEALTGRNVFEGETAADSLAKILGQQPEWHALPQTIPPSLRRLLQRSLQKDARQRLHDIADARIVLGEETDPDAAVDLVGPAAQTPPSRWSNPSRLALLGAVAIVAAALGALGTWFGSKAASPDDAPREPIRFILPLEPEQHLFTDVDALLLAISHDGRRLAWLGSDDGRIYTRSLADLEALTVRDAQLAESWSLFLSPDGEWIGYTQGAQVWKIPFEGGAPTKLYESDRGAAVLQADWGDDGSLVVAEAGSGLILIPAGGGHRSITDLDRERREVSHERPHFLPGSRAVLFSVGVGNWHDNHVEVIDTETGTRRSLIEDASLALWASSGHLLFARDGTLFAVPFDLERLEIAGAEAPVLTDVQMDTIAGRVAQAVLSRSGTLAYVPAVPGFGESRVVRIDRSGSREFLELARANYRTPAPSPQGGQLAVSSRLGHRWDILLYDLARRVPARFTFEGSWNWAPVWSPDGSRIVFQSNRAGQWNLWAKPLGGATQAVRLLESDSFLFPTSWSADGSLLAYIERTRRDDFNIWLLKLDEEGGEPTPFVATRFRESLATFSPDGKWLAYVSDEEGRPEVFLREVLARGNGGSAIGAGDKWKVSRQGGWEPFWSPRGDELFYLDSIDGRRLLSVALGTGSELEIGAERVVFDALELPASSWIDSGWRYQVAPNGGSFVFVVEQPVEEGMELVVVLDWLETLKSVEAAGD